MHVHMLARPPALLGVKILLRLLQDQSYHIARRGSVVFLLQEYFRDQFSDHSHFTFMLNLRAQGFMLCSICLGSRFGTEHDATPDLTVLEN